ncbi:MAG: hypothetical protein IKT39_02000 [Clostridia bacterium]|nr:hypothetical protein [Clostridia bacterium]
MKKTVLIFVMVTLLVFSAFGASAANYSPTKDNAGNYSYTVKCKVESLIDTGAGSQDNAAAIVNGESMYGLVAVVGTGDGISLETADSFVYIDQATVDNDGYVTFAGFLPMGESPAEFDAESDAAGNNNGKLFEECTLFIGGPGYATAKQLGVLKDASAVPVTCKVKDSDQRIGVATVTVYDSTGTTEIAKLQSEVSSGDIVVNVPTGTGYRFEFSKTNYCKYTLTGVDVAGDITLPEVDMTTLAGNADGLDGVNAFDLDAVLGNFGATESNYDTTGDGAINAFDLDAVLGNFGRVDVITAYTAE